MQFLGKIRNFLGILVANIRKALYIKGLIDFGGGEESRTPV